jgi:endonuclease YncB( thermonuclease family)
MFEHFYNYITQREPLNSEATALPPSRETLVSRVAIPPTEVILPLSATPFEQLLHSTKPEPCLPVSVHDGDTMCVNVMFPFSETDASKKFPVTFTIRLLGYDCAEIIPKGPLRTKKSKLQEKILGTISKWAFIKKIGFVSETDIRKNQIVHVKFEGMDKYGRTLGTVYVGDTNINEYMIASNFAYSYEGATKDCATYISSHFDTFYAMIEDGSIETYVSSDGLTELRKLVTEYAQAI